MLKRITLSERTLQSILMHYIIGGMRSFKQSTERVRRALRHIKDHTSMNYSSLNIDVALVWAVNATITMVYGWSPYQLVFVSNPNIRGSVKNN